ncbi:ImmA/IrrE family metallo-endopeptidase [Candidatus Poribacteria bacterium]|nr:ImmA/IrrE family metallo-endopeptidase [Candidatus Poribacteria bacterium]
MGRPVQVINEIIKGVKSITPDTAIQLEHVLGTPAHVWLNLENDYQLTKARLQEARELQEQIFLLKDIPYAEMARLGWVRNVKKKTEQVRELILFFSVSSLADAFPSQDSGSGLVRERESAYGRTLAEEPSRMALAAWLRKGEIEAHRIRTVPYDEKRLKASLNLFRELTREVPPKFLQKLIALCAERGVALVFVPSLPRMYAHSSTRWLSPGKALIQLSVRHKYDDTFWFSFFHGIGHILLHGKREAFVEAERDGMAMNPEELEADKFAADTLIPPREFRGFVSCPPFTKANVIEFARAVGIAPSIVVGRLHYEGLLRESHLNGLRSKLEIKRGR